MANRPDFVAPLSHSYDVYVFNKPLEKSEKNFFLGIFLQKPILWIYVLSLSVLCIFLKIDYLCYCN